MTPTLSPVTGALPQQPAPTSTNCAPAPPPLSATPVPQTQQAALGAAPINATTAATAAALGGGSVQAAQGAIAVSPEQLIPAIQGLVESINKLVAALQGGVHGGGAPGGAPGQVGQCGMPGCTMDHDTAAPTQGGANAGPTSSNAGPTSNAGPASGAVARIDPSTVQDKAGTGGLTGPSLRGLQEAHKFNLPLVSGKRSGNGKSDHDHGNAIDVGTLAIGSPSSTDGTPQMKAFAEHMRQQGKAAQLNVKYVIADGRIASATNNWEWREYTYPGKSQASLDALKQSNRGEYNRIQHYDHVHVSFS